MKKITSIILLSFILAAPLLAEELSSKLSGRILLQVEGNGESWYVSPGSGERFFLGRPADAFLVMREHGIGITNFDLQKIPIGLIKYNDQDDDNDGLANRLEVAIGTNPKLKDTDHDGHDDYTEIINSFNPLNSSKALVIDKDFSLAQAGKIMLQVEGHGEAWYINPLDQKRYYLGRPSDAFLVMRELGLGITNSNLAKIPIHKEEIKEKPEPTEPTKKVEKNCDTSSPEKVLKNTSEAIRERDLGYASSCVLPATVKRLEYALDYLSQKELYNLANIMLAAKLESETEVLAVYKIDAHFALGGYNVPIRFVIEKQESGQWLLTNL